MPPSKPTITRSGSYVEIASAFGRKLESVVFGAFVGKFELSSTAATCEPAPTAYRSSVAVGESDTIRVGRFAIVTGPFAAWIVTGKSGGVAACAPETGNAAAASATANSFDIRKPPRERREVVRRRRRPNRPSSEG